MPPAELEALEVELAPDPPVQAARLNAAASATPVTIVRVLRMVFSFEGFSMNAVELGIPR